MREVLINWRTVGDMTWVPPARSPPGSLQVSNQRQEQNVHPKAPPTRNPGEASEAREDARPVGGSRGASVEEDCRPGQIHSSHVAYETQRYLFGAVCGTYGQYIKRTRLHTVCPRQPRNRWAKLAIEDLQQGIEPGGRRTHAPAVPDLAD